MEHWMISRLEASSAPRDRDPGNVPYQERMLTMSNEENPTAPEKNIGTPKHATFTRSEFISQTLRVTSATYVGMKVIDSFLAPITGSTGAVLAAAPPASPSIATDGCTC